MSTESIENARRNSSTASSAQAASPVPSSVQRMMQAGKLKGGGPQQQQQQQQTPSLVRDGDDARRGRGRGEQLPHGYRQTMQQQQQANRLLGMYVVLVFAVFFDLVNKMCCVCVVFIMKDSNEFNK